MSDQWYPEPSKQQEETIQQEESKTIASLPVIQEVLDWFDEQIAIYKNPSVIEGVNPSTPAEDIKAAVLLAQGRIDDYRTKRDEFINRFSKYIQEAADES